MEDWRIFFAALFKALYKIEQPYFNVPNGKPDSFIFGEPIYLYELYRQMRNSLPRTLPFIVGREMEHNANQITYGNAAKWKPDFLVPKMGKAGDKFAVMEIKSMKNTSVQDIIDDYNQLMTYVNGAGYEYAILIVYGKTNEEQFLSDLCGYLKEKDIYNKSLVIWHKSPLNIEFEWLTNQDKKGLKISVVSSRESWLNNYIPEFLLNLHEKGCMLKWSYNANDLQVGDMAFILGYDRLIPANILKRNRHNLVVHESDLPHGKGWSPMTWQVLEGKRDISIVLLEAAEKVDSGLIYLKEEMHLNGTELVEEWRKKQAEYTFRLCMNFIEQYPSIVNRAVKQDGKSTYYRRRTPEDSRLDPNKTIREQFNLLRVVDNEHYPAFFNLDGKEYVLKVFEKED